MILRVLRGTARQYELLQVVLRDTTRYYECSTSHYEKLRVILGGTMRYYELVYESLCGITRGFRCFFPMILDNCEL